MSAEQPGVHGAKPRTILSIDGGGVRGILALEVLVQLEAALARERPQAPPRLCAHFDLVAGTSIGAVFAAMIAKGIAVTEIREFFLKTLTASFTPARWRDRLYFHYDKRFLETGLKEKLGADTLLGSSALQTLLLLVLSNATTNAPWIVSNHPSAPFNQPDRDDCNLQLPLWQLVRASAAAPTYFAPEVITFGQAQPYPFMFVDGGLTGLNNPAFKAFLFATTEAYGLNWPAHERRLTVVSIGTGELRGRFAEHAPRRLHLLRLAAMVPAALMDASAREQDLLCRSFGRCLAGDPIDQEVGDMKLSKTAVEPRLFSYFRINAQLSRAGLEALGCGHIDAAAVAPLDAVGEADSLRQIGQAIGRRGVSRELLDHITGGAA